MMKQSARRQSKKCQLGNNRKMHVECLEDRRVLAASVGWDGPGQGSADLTYYIQNAPPSLTMQQVASAIQTALKAWSSVVDVDFTAAPRAGLPKSIDISFQRIDGNGGTLAYAYFPSSSTRSTIAGDVVFDSADPWEIGNAKGSSAFDLVAVAVHEIGHSLGLDHLSEQAANMFASISASEVFTGLDQSDITAIRQLYATRQVTTPSQDTSSNGGSTLNNSDTGTGGTGTGSTTNKSAGAQWLGLPLSLLSTLNDSTIEDAFSKLDSNADQALTKDELPVRLQRYLQKLNVDADADGSITLDELKTAVRAAQTSLFERIDADDDGSLSSSEVSSKVWEILGRADTDTNGLVTLEEFVAFQQKSMFDRFDTNADGEITEDEVSENIWSRISKLDRDASGTVSAVEFSSTGSRNGRGRCGESLNPVSNAATSFVRTFSSLFSRLSSSRRR